MIDPTRGAGETRADDDLLADLTDDFLRRYRAGEHPAVDEYAAQHPALADRIRDLFPAMVAMEHPAGFGPTLDPAPPAERVGATIGRYKLLERIGEGGFGVVYMAEQLTPVRRKVALKLVKPGMDSRQVLARFEAERQALAIMDHPNIARVLDAGATDAGRPYFVMELVKGVPITDFCDQHQLTPRQRLELFAHVCHAVQHAHQKGIIHRDIKPTNVLVMMHDTAPVVKVIDFGVAKALGQELTEKTLFTGFAQLVGTPLYMSPEQAGQSALDVDTRSDIYSLGVLLYELLTGTTPIDKERFKRAAQDEMRRIIREEEPPRPSTRLSESRDALPSISAQRHTEPAKLTKLVRGELDWIVMKALEKDRARRYETVNGLARDVERYLHDEPVQACPPSASYRLRKFAHRHRVPLAVAAGFLLLLVAGTVVSSYQAIRIRAEQKNTLAQKLEADKQRDDAKTQRAEADRNRTRAEQELARAAAAEQKALTEASKSEQVATFLREMLQGVGLSVAEGRDTAMLREILDRTAKRLDQLKDQPAVEADMCLVLGNVYLELRDAQSAEAVLSRGVSLREQLPGRSDLMSRLLIALGSSQADLRRFAEAERSLTEALTIERERFGPNAWYVGYTLSCLGTMHRGKGDNAQAEAFFRDALRIFLRYRASDVSSLRCITAALDQLAMSLSAQGKYAEAEPISRGSLALARAMAPPQGNGALAHALLNLGMVLLDQGKGAEAAPHLREALDIQKSLGHPDTLGFQYKLAESLVACNVREAVVVLDEYVRPAAGKDSAPMPLHDVFEERITQFQGSANAWERLNRTDADYYFHAACWRGVIASVLRGADRSPEGVRRADAEADRAMEWLKKAVDAGFTDRARVREWDHLEALRDRDDYRRLVAGLPPTDNVVAAAPGEVPRRGGASAQEPAAERKPRPDGEPAELSPAVKAHPDPIHVGVYNLLGFILNSQKRFEPAIAAYRKAIEFDPESCRAPNNLAWLLATCSDARLRDPAAAVALAETAVRIHPGDSGHLSTLHPSTIHLRTLGAAHYRAGDWKAAVAALETSMQRGKGGNSFDWFFLAMAEWQSGNRGAAHVWYEKAVGWMEENGPNDAELTLFRAEAAELIGAVLPQELDPARQRPWEREVAELSKAVARHPGSPNAVAARARWLMAHGRFAEAERDYERLVRLHPADPWHWFNRGCLLAYLGRERDYREHRRAMLAHFADARDAYVLHATTRAALLLPPRPGGVGGDEHAGVEESVDGLVEGLLRRAERAHELEPGTASAVLLMGIAEHRAGRCEQSAEWLEKFHQIDRGRWAAGTAAADAYLALARHRLGQATAARAALERAARRAEANVPPADSAPRAGNDIHDWPLAQIAVWEAEEAILGRPRPAAPQASGSPVPPPPPSPSAPSPFRGAPAALPGVVQAEDFDDGGQGVAYHDTTYQNFNALGEAAATYRLESVDLEPSSDTGQGFIVAGVRAAEWLSYTVGVKEAGTYDVGLRVCSPGGGRLHVEFGGTDVTGPMDVPKTGWNTWTTVTARGVRLEAGRQVMRVVFDAATPPDVWVCNLNWVEARRSP